MAGAMIDAILSTGMLSANALHVFDVSEEKCKFYAQKGLVVEPSNRALVAHCELLFLAVKPQMVETVLDEITGLTDGKCMVSIAAGVPIARLRKALGENTYFVRVMPNTPLLVQQGATVIAAPDQIADTYLDLIVSVFRAAGMVEFLPEEKINAVIPVSSSSPAFFFRMVRAMAESGERNGIPYDTALRLAIATMNGAAHILAESGKTPDELITQVSSPGGTTIAALSAFDELKFETLIDEAFSRCIHRAEELGAN